MNKQYGLMFCLCALLLQGCGNQVAVSGKVTFSDGSPLTRGEVRFQTSTFMASGNIQPDGSYILSSLGKDDGIPAGTYTVTVTAYEAPSDIAGKMPSDLPLVSAKSLIDLKYSSPQTSGMSVDVRGSMVHNITVTAPQ